MDTGQFDDADADADIDFSPALDRWRSEDAEASSSNHATMPTLKPPSIITKVNSSHATIAASPIPKQKTNKAKQVAAAGQTKVNTAAQHKPTQIAASKATVVQRRARKLLLARQNRTCPGNLHVTGVDLNKYANRQEVTQEAKATAKTSQLEKNNMKPFSYKPVTLVKTPPTQTKTRTEKTATSEQATHAKTPPPTQTNTHSEKERAASEQEVTQVKTHPAKTNNQPEKRVDSEQTTVSKKRDSPAKAIRTSPRKAKNRLQISHISRVDKTWALAEFKEGGPVACASRIIGDELQHGLWPSPFQVEPFKDIITAEHQHKDHMKIVAASLDHFARNVITPSMEQYRCTTKRRLSQDTLPTTFLAALLALREVIVQNAEKIFGKESFSELAVDEEAKRGNQDRAHPNRLDQEEDRLYCASILATGVILSAVERLIPNQAQEIIGDFLEVIQQYENGDEAFASCLEPDNGRSRGILPNGRRLHREENIALNVSYNRARVNHPLIRMCKEREMKLRRRELIDVPRPNACHIAMFEKLSGWTQRPPGNVRNRDSV
jgi:hypothetical protein